MYYCLVLLLNKSNVVTCCWVRFSILSSLLSADMGVRKKIECQLIPGEVVFHISSVSSTAALWSSFWHEFYSSGEKLCPCFWAWHDTACPVLDKCQLITKKKENIITWKQSSDSPLCLPVCLSSFSLSVCLHLFTDIFWRPFSKITLTHFESH